ncbi:hypothetical protein GCK32_000617, partial [Trichostrongylus colubriformis]
FLATRSDASSKVAYLTGISQQLRTEIVRGLIPPFCGALTTYVLSKINTIDLAGFSGYTYNLMTVFSNSLLYVFSIHLDERSFRARVESLKTAIVEPLHLLNDDFVHSEALFGHDVKKVVQRPID